VIEARRLQRSFGDGLIADPAWQVAVARTEGCVLLPSWQQEFCAGK